MSETYQFNLPLIQAAQAQKHVTHNAAICLLDAMAQLRLVAVNQTVPPTTLTDGKAYHLGVSATGDWFGQDGRVAVTSNGGWVFADPKTGWRAWIEAASATAQFDGSAWVYDAVSVNINGAVTRNHIIEIDHTVQAGAVSTTTTVLPQNGMVFGVTGRIIEAITTDVTATWQLGVSGSANRYGSGYGLSLNSYIHSVSSAPTTYYSDTALELTCSGGVFVAGKVRLCVHVLEIGPPASV